MGEEPTGLRPLGRHGSGSVRDWHVRWTQVAEALRLLHEARNLRKIGPEADSKVIKGLPSLPLFHGLAVPGDTEADRGRLLERTLLAVLQRLRQRLTTPVRPRDLAAQAIVCWCLHVLDGLTISAVAGAFPKRYLALETGDWKGTGWDPNVRATTVRTRMWPRGVNSPHDFLPGAGEGLRRIADAVDEALQPFHSAVSGRSPGPDQTLPRLLPHGLPSSSPHFTDRRRELGILDRWLRTRTNRGSSRTVLVTGAAGVGKTAFALHWLHALTDRFVDGALYADLRGFGADRPKAPEAVLGQFLQALGVVPESIPGVMEEQIALYRSLMAGRRMLVLLDDAASAAQVRPLLPGSTESVVVVTSRWRLGGLLADGAELLVLEPLEADAAVELLARFAGTPRVEADPAAARALVKQCGLLPIAVCVVGARLAARPQSSIARLVEELACEQQRLGTLSVEDVSVEAAFDWSYCALPGDAARAYRLTGLLPGAHFGKDAAAAAAGLPVEEADRLLGVLVDASMLQDVGEHRYAFHDLLHLHARMKAETNDPPAERQATIGRALDWYLATADAADRAVMPHRRRQPRTYLRPPVTPASFEDPTCALAWLEAERSNLLASVQAAADQKLHATVWQLVDAMWSLFLHRKHYHDWIESHHAGIASARACGDQGGETMLLNHLGLGLHGLGRFEEASARFNQALAIHRASGDRRGEATALNSLGLALHGLGRIPDAIDHLVQAATIQRSMGDLRGEALTSVNLGEAYAEAGERARARRHLLRARSAFAALPDPYNEARALHVLRRFDARAGEAECAIRDLEHALSVMRALGSRFEEAQVLEVMGDAARAAGDERAASGYYEQALARYERVGGPHAGQLRGRVNAGTWSGGS